MAGPRLLPAALLRDLALLSISAAPRCPAKRAATDDALRGGWPARTRGPVAGRSTHLDDEPTICKPTGRPVAENPAGTDIAGFDIIVTYQHDRIQSMYVVIAVPAIRSDTACSRRTARPVSPEE